MKFEEFPVVMLNANKIKAKFIKLIENFNAAQDEKAAYSALKKFQKYTDDVDTDCTVIMISYSIDTTNEHVRRCNNLLNNVLPVVTQYKQEFYKALLESPYRQYIEGQTGKYLFDMIEASMKTFDPKIIPLMVQEKELCDKYDEIRASIEVGFRGGTYNLSQMSPFRESTDRATRKEADTAFYRAVEEKADVIGDIYDKLVKIRDQMAHELGFKNYVELGYLNLGRLDYNAEDVAKYRDQIRDNVVRYCNRLNNERLKRLGIKDPKFYDSSLFYKEGNPKPLGNEEDLVSKASVMYHQLSKDTGGFFDFMVDNHLMDLSAKKGKVSGGFMAYLPKYRCPFIFANFNGTSGDIDTLTHEFGHAFQTYESRSIKIPEYRSPTLEACEIHSMSMEFLTYPYMDMFFEDATRYKKQHLESAITFLPYGATVDEFQHFVYENPDATPEERCNIWLQLEKKYTPHKINEGCPFLENGHRWMLQAHIFQSPFYYIDYTLAQVCAFQFFIADTKSHEKAWKKYIKLCKLGGQYPFVTLLEKAKIKNPFEDNTIKKIIVALRKIDDTYNID